MSRIATRLRIKKPQSDVVLENVFSSVGEGIVVYDRELRYQVWSPFMERLTGLSDAHVLGRRALEVFPLLVDQGVDELLYRALEGESVESADRPFRDPSSGAKGWIVGRYWPHRNSAGEIIGVVGLIRDISERKRAEQALTSSERELEIHNRVAEAFLTVADEEMYERVLEIVLEALDSRHGVFGHIDTEGSLVCPSMTRDIFEQCQMPGKSIVFPRDSWAGIWGTTLTTRKAVLSNSPGKVPDGHIAIGRCVFVPIVDREELIGLLAVANRETDYSKGDLKLMESVARRIGPILHARLARDVEENQRLQAAEDLHRALAEKNVLLKEVHHRVKNNMAVISSMISLQSEDFTDPETKDGMTKIQGRIRAMALVHDQLYHSKNFHKVDLGEYARRLTDALFQTHPERAGKVDLQTRIADVAMTIDLAIPCGLILNELVSNSLDYAFPDDQSGEIVVSLDLCEDGRLELGVMDNGVGSREETGADQRNGFGLQLVDLLAKQLGGEVETRWNPGTDVRVRFAYE